MPDSSPWISDGTEANFQTEVLDRSQEATVVVDFWAPWCGPCRQLGPVLERLIEEQNGRARLVKVNVDEQPRLAAIAGAQSIPYVLAFREGQPIDQFVGAMPEAQLREWLGRLLPSPAETLLQEGLAAEASDLRAAEGKFREALVLAPDLDAAKVSLARVLFAQDREEECRGVIEELESRGFLEPEAEQIKSQLELREAAEEAGGLQEARRAAEANPDDLGLQLKLADALAVEGKYREALDICLDVIGRDKAGAGVEAKATMLRIFDTLGPQSELTGQYRRKLATALY